MAFQRILYYFILLIVTSFATPDEERNGRVFSLFSVVTFPNGDCILASASSNRGKCYSASECTSKGGAADGSCAAGFGVCCRFEQTKCDSEVSQNGSYIVNSNATGTCKYTIKEFRTGICQLRLDFVTFTTTTSDTFIVNTTTGYLVPPIAGTMTGQHIYIDADRASSTKATLTFTQTVVAGETTVRSWRILVTQFACDDPTRAPSDCLQYFTGISDVISSFNYPNSMLANQVYNICIKQRQGYCAIDYSTTDSGTPDGFNLGTTGTTVTTALTDTDCTDSWISIENVISPVATRFCGEYLSNVPSAPSSGIVRDVGAPFEVGVYNPTAANTVGFQLTFSQVPCS